MRIVESRGIIHKVKLMDAYSKGFRSQEFHLENAIFDD
jgi:hypothetical protein